MKHRIRAAALLVEDDRILLVHHVDPQTAESFWVPPGGGLEEEDASVFHCARREVFEETGLEVWPSRIAWIAEFCDERDGVVHLELFLAGGRAKGEITLEHLPPGQPDSDMIQEARWVHRDELDALQVYPAELRDAAFWQSIVEEGQGTCYLGRRVKKRGARPIAEVA
jgi:8-oxo-dGTP pyrophosphatase MutT (NUDIX family)